MTKKGKGRKWSGKVREGQGKEKGKKETVFGKEIGGEAGLIGVVPK